MSKKKICITGGAGYLGSVLTNLLLRKGYKVKILDSLMYGGEQLIEHVQNKNFEFVKGDIRNESHVKKNIEDVDVIIHLAAIVGYPACSKNKKFATDINVNGTKNVLKHKKKNQLIIYASTGSNYGSIAEVCTEETKLNPLTVYGKTKTKSEKLVSQSNNFIAFRFATAFGSSPRMRLDLMINDFVYKLMTQNYLVVYEKNFMRTFIHVKDIARSFLHAIEKHKIMKNQIYNIGDDRLNYSKEEVCNMIKKKLDGYVYFAEIGEDKDKRNYIVSYDKIRKTGFRLKYDLDYGINELIQTMPLINNQSKFFNA